MCHMNELFLAFLLEAICHVESGNTRTAINTHDSGSASYGSCQIKLSTARWLGFKGNVSDLWFNETTNKYYAGKYLDYLAKRYKGNLDSIISAYNCGKVCNNQKYVNKVRSELNGKTSGLSARFNDQITEWRNEHRRTESEITRVSAR